MIYCQHNNFCILSYQLVHISKCITQWSLLKCNVAEYINQIDQDHQTETISLVPCIKFVYNLYQDIVLYTWLKICFLVRQWTQMLSLCPSPSILTEITNNRYFLHKNGWFGISHYFWNFRKLNFRQIRACTCRFSAQGPGDRRAHSGCEHSYRVGIPGNHRNMQISYQFRKSPCQSLLPLC